VTDLSWIFINLLHFFVRIGITLCTVTALMYFSIFDCFLNPAIIDTMYTNLDQYFLILIDDSCHSCLPIGKHLSTGSEDEPIDHKMTCHNHKIHLLFLVGHIGVHDSESFSS